MLMMFSTKYFLPEIIFQGLYSSLIIIDFNLLSLKTLLPVNVITVQGVAVEFILPHQLPFIFGFRIEGVVHNRRIGGTAAATGCQQESNSRQRETARHAAMKVIHRIPQIELLMLRLRCYPTTPARI